MYLWIDLWDKRCGIALELEWVVVPKAIVPRVELVQRIKKLLEEYSITRIIVWLPYDLYGKDKKQLNKTNLFIEKLKNIFPQVHIEWIDERFTSFEADNILQEMWGRNIWNKKDDLSAVLILESYIRKKKKEK